MKTKFYSIAIILVSQPTLFGFGCIGNEVRQNYKTVACEFSGVELKTSANVFITQSDEASFRIEAEESSKESIMVETFNDRLIISSKDDSNWNKEVNIFVTIKELNTIKLSGSGTITFLNKVKCDNLDLRLSGSGNINGNIDSKFLTISLSGSGNIELKGSANESELNISGSGNVNGRDLKSTSSTIKITGSGTSIVDVADKLDVEINGSGNVYYISNPERMHAKSRGSGKVEKIKA